VQALLNIGGQQQPLTAKARTFMVMPLGLRNAA
jgi:hypothetical protein